MLTLLAVAEHASAEGSKTAFYIAGGALALWAVLIGALGVARPSFAQSEGSGRAVMAVSVLLVAATMTAAVAVS